MIADLGGTLHAGLADANLVVRAVYRYSEGINRKSRPPWFSKHACLESFIRSLDRVDASEVHFIVDGRIDEAIEHRMSERGAVHRFSGAGNSGTFRLALEISLSGPDPQMALLAEDDHLWRADAIPAMVSALGSISSADYVTTYRHPDHERRTAYDRSSRGGISALDADGRSWQTIPSTVMTFGARPRALRDDTWLFRLQSQGEHPNDELIFNALQGLGRRRWALLHLLSTSTTRGRFTRATRLMVGRPSPRLWCTSNSLSAHAETGMLPEGFEGG